MAGKVCIIGLQNLHLMQFLYKYADILDKENIDYDVICWDRDPEHPVKQKPFGGRKIVFSFPMSNYIPKYRKIIGYLKCLHFTCQQIRKNRYDKLILLITQTALPLFVLSRHVRKSSYIYDYRDITYERMWLCKKIIQHIINKSEFTAISSEGFKQVLGENGKFLISHNVSNLKYVQIHKNKSKRIRLVYWGIVRQTAFNKKVCDLFGRDSRFELCYHGECESDELQRYCQERGYSRVQFTGRYTTDQIPSFVENTDILLNLYENDAIQKLATTVKLYDGIRYGLPMLIAKGSHMAELMKDNQAVYPIDIETADRDAVYKWYDHLEQPCYHYEKELQMILEDDEKFRVNLLKCVKE